MRILVIEDEKKVATFIKKGLVEEHYAVDTAFDGEEGLYLAEINQYDLIVLDLMIPKIDGFGVLKKIGNGESRPHPRSHGQGLRRRHCERFGCGM